MFIVRSNCCMLFYSAMNIASTAQAVQFIASKAEAQSVWHNTEEE